MDLKKEFSRLESRKINRIRLAVMFNKCQECIKSFRDLNKLSKNKGKFWILF